jgi:hypothetical protein
MWTHYVEWSGDILAFQHPYQRINHIVPVNPGHILLTIAKAASKPALERQQHALQESTFRAHHDASGVLGIIRPKKT